ncbi:phosphate regulon sensor histidine kinase PhoR [Acidihalobacter prosperus]|uniref:Phosphate regulon sensor protein PhoR n=1 Tax=Acidihalobacter prosperus TaxID=160660 RepID=A0A1A6C228_9GAMM|nr:phosphate regulon sensor histidine kinase PhoR [Acidihalobacter prosperus]OBS08605.1 two-component sensor histidine kinase [Acidihalobacter prosperus]
MTRAWLAELGRLALILLAATALGALAGQLVWMLLAGLLFALSFHLYQLYRVHRWILHAEDRGNPPDAMGVWGELVDSLYRFGKRHRKRKERLASLLDRFNEFTSAMPDATVVIGANNEIRWLNEAATMLFGLRNPQDIGQRLTNLIRHPDFIHYLAGRDYREPLEITSPVRDDIRLSVRIVPFGNHERLLAARDISHLYRLEQMRRDFVANVSHELRTPLTVLMGYLETFGDMADEFPAPLRQSLSHMQGQSTRMQGIIEDLLMLSRLDGEGPLASEQSAVAVPGLVSALREDAEALSGAGKHRIEAEIDETLWLRGDAKELHSAFANLVSNAVRYTPQGGAIKLRWVRDGDGACFEVRDTGIGIDPEHIPRLTERFYRVNKDRSRDTGGTGLGLAIVKHVLQRHGAKLVIRSHPGEGSVFVCLFPSLRVVRKLPEAHSARA